MKARMPLDRTEGVAQNIRTKARAAHAEKDDVRKAAAEEVELAELARLLEHLVGHVEPAKSVVDFLSLVWIGAPQGGVLRPKTAGRVVLLELRQLGVDGGLQPAEAVPLTRALARLDVLRVLLEGGQQAVERFRERLDAFDLELVRHLVEIHADLRELLQLAARQVHVFVQAAADLAVLAEGGPRGRRGRVHGVRANELLDVVRVGIARVLGRGAGPQAPLRPGAGLAQLVPARPGEELLVVLVRHLRVGDRSFAVEPLQRLLLLRIRWSVVVLGTPLVDYDTDEASAM